MNVGTFHRAPSGRPFACALAPKLAKMPPNYPPGLSKVDPRDRSVDHRAALSVSGACPRCASVVCPMAARCVARAVRGDRFSRSFAAGLSEGIEVGYRVEGI